MFDPSYTDSNSALNLSMALFAGLVIGIERQRSHRSDAVRICGMRDYILIAMLAYISSTFDDKMHIVWDITLIAVIVYSLFAFVFDHLPFSAEKISGGMTSIMAMPFTFLIASLPNFGIDFWIMATLLFAFIFFMNMKDELHAFGVSLTHRDIGDFAILLGIVISITPLIPQETNIMIPLPYWENGVFGIHYDEINVSMLWQVVSLVSIMSFFSHFITKYLRGRKALALATFFGGMVSGLATASLLHANPRAPGALTDRERFMGLATTNAGATVRGYVIFRMVLGQKLFAPYMLTMVSCAVLFIAVSVYSYNKVSTDQTEEFHLTERPLPLRFVYNFTAVFSGLILIMGMMKFYLGNGSLIFGSFVAGIVSSGSALGALGTSMLQDGTLTGWIAGLSVIAALTGGLVPQVIISIKSVGFKSSVPFLILTLFQSILGTLTILIAFHTKP